MIRYVIRRVLTSFRDNPVVSAITISTLAGAAFVLAMVAVALVNVEALAERWTRDAPVVAYLKPEALDAKDLVRVVERHADVAGVRRISPAEALAELRASAGESAWIFDGLDADNPLPTTLEVRLTADARDGDRLGALTRWIAGLDGVESVEGAGGWLEGFLRVRRWVRWVAAGLALATLSAAALVVSNTIRLMVYGRMREIRILRTVGASDFLIRVPFMIEGALHALVGLGLAVGALWGGLALLARDRPWVREIGFLTPVALGSLALVFVALATITSLVSVRRCLEESLRSSS